MSISFSSAFSYLAVALAASKNETLISPSPIFWKELEAEEGRKQVEFWRRFNLQSVKSFREHFLYTCKVSCIMS